MKIRPISRVMTATALTNPDPSFVSVCTGPANQTPFHAVRNDDSINADVKPETDMKIKRSKAASAVVIAQKGYSVMQFAFDKNVFKTADDVTKFLTEGGYEQTEMVETAKAFEVSDASGTRFEVGSTEVIKGAIPGVTAYVGKMANATDEDQIVEDEPAAEPAEGTSTVETQKTEGDAPRPDVVARERTRTGDAPAEPAPAVEPAPAAEPEVQPGAAPEGAVIDAELAQKIDAVLAAHPSTAKRGVGCYTLSSIVDVICSLRYLVNDADYTDLDDNTVSQLKQAAVASLAALTAAVSQFSTEMSSVFRSDADATSVKRSETTAEPEAPAAPVEPVAPTEPAPAITQADVARMIAEAVAPIEARATQAETEASEARQRAEQAEGDLAARVEAEQSVTQTRKAADDLDPPASTTETKEPAKRSRASSRILESFGSRHVR